MSDLIRQGTWRGLSCRFLDSRTALFSPQRSVSPFKRFTFQLRARHTSKVLQHELVSNALEDRSFVDADEAQIRLTLDGLPQIPKPRLVTLGRTQFVLHHLADFRFRNQYISASLSRFRFPLAICWIFFLKLRLMRFKTDMDPRQYFSRPFLRGYVVLPLWQRALE